MSGPRFSMLPGVLAESGSSRRTTRDWIVDASMLAVGAFVGLVALGGTEHYRTEQQVNLDFVVGVLCFIPLWWRRRRPWLVFLLLTPVGAFSAMAAGPGLIALFNLALRGTRRQIVISVILSCLIGIVYSVVFDDPELPMVIDLAFAVLFPLVVVPWGLFTRAQRDLLLTAHERAEKAEAEQRAHVEAARETERRRIAGEMHDVLAHRLSLLSVHAGALEFRPDATPEEIEQAAGVIRQTATDALRDLRHVIGVLRTGDGVTAPPQPTVDAIPALIEESRAAGMHVRSRVEASGGEVMVGRTAYRIVQEGLTNARKHAPAAAVEVTVGPSDSSLVVEVVSRKSALAPPAAPGGSGLIGLTERVELAGGSLECGPNPRGDFVLRAVLPWT
ncbi:sensor histidine kinase [Solirubrobacter sp. CPCC 204708]|uniref:histidine kinase n=1 Tax=Solirubrobacter deserti TaxID=2282478 RepID=A0ABT4RMX5_9ACTN|nr:histidine kinase [Solirubrobacter deserti]MBE2315013.1 sensor histidine kinase [Solirubrobacter deserti]MDA0139928.1 histidine kinase [Solirubrobacter deserti]